MIRCWGAATLLWTSHAFSARSTCPPPVRVHDVTVTALSATTTTSSYPQVDQRTGKPTGVSFLPAATIERAETGTPVEKVKLEKDGTSAFVDVYEYARKIRAGEMTWEEVDKADLDSVRFLGAEARRGEAHAHVRIHVRPTTSTTTCACVWILSVDTSFLCLHL
jgi:hypothetical protein